MTSRPMGRKVFLSYAREDSTFAERLYRDLKAYGLEVWWDQRSLLPGKDWDREIGAAIQSSDRFIALLSSNSVNKRGVVQREIRRAIAILDDLPEGADFLIPVRLDDCRPSHDRIRERQWVDFFPSWEVGLGSLLRAFGIERASLYDTNKRLFQVMGLFRHSLLGPVQGLSSAALGLARIAEDASPNDPYVRDLRSQLEEEILTIRLWRENYRFIIRERIDLRLHQQPLGQLVRRILEEHASLFRSRGLTVDVKSAVATDAATVPVDLGAYSAALSNLLDNARKYAFYGTTVALHLRTAEASAVVAITNIGHPVPEFVQEALDRPPQLPDSDITSWILARRGFGLEIARAVAEAHGGSLTCQTLPARKRSEGPESLTKPHEVTFTLSIPTDARGGRTSA